MKLQLSVIAPLALAACSLSWGASIDVYISKPGAQFSPIAGSTSESFDALATGNMTSPFLSTIGTYALSSTVPFNIQGANQYGGANNTKYMAFGAQSGTSAPILLTMPGEQNYFGFWWSAGDNNNGLTFYRAGVELARFSTADIVTILTPKAGNVQALDGNLYAKSSYYGNPNAPLGRNSNEPYAYVVFLGNGVGFDQILFDNSGKTGSGFESDNHSIYADNVVLPADHVFVKYVTSSALDAVPEPGTVGLSAAGLCLLALAYLRKK